MNAEDDPEARIRELERSVSGLGSAVELTAPSVGNRPRVIGVGALASVLAIAGAAALFLFSGGSTSTTPGHPTMPSGAAPTPSRSSTVPPPAAAPPTNPITPIAPGPDRAVTLTISGAGENKTLACTGNQVSVSGVSNTVVLTGQCAGLTVSGIGNVITVDLTATITASGLNNRVTYRSGDPQVSTSGFDNVVERG